MRKPPWLLLNTASHPRGAVCIYVHLRVFPLNMPIAWMATQVSETALHLELIDLAGTMCIHG